MTPMSWPQFYAEHERLYVEEGGRRPLDEREVTAMMGQASFDYSLTPGALSAAHAGGDPASRPRLRPWFVRVNKKKQSRCSPWSAPVKVWLMALRPAWRRRDIVFLQGIGSDRFSERAPSYRSGVLLALSAARRSGYLPLASSGSVVWPMPKLGEAVGVRAWRLIHGVCDFWKSFTVAHRRRAALPRLSGFRNGFVAGRRREGATSVVRAVSLRLSDMAISPRAPSSLTWRSWICTLLPTATPRTARSW